MTTTETWLDIMPAIPLARGVPVRDHDDVYDQRGLVLYTREPGEIIEYDGPGAGVLFDGDIETTECSLKTVRVDLDDPQGFGYALRYCLRAPLGVLKLAHALGFGTGVGEQYSGSDMKGWIVGWAATDLATDQDRLALARALAEVTR